MNRSLSVQQTLGMDILYPAYEYEVEQMDAKPARAAPKSGETKKVPKGERHVPIPRGEFNRASLTSDEHISRMIELGGISDAELGSARLDRPGVWFAKQFEIRQKLEKTRLEALAVMKEGLARMMIKQFLSESEGVSAELLVGRTGRKNKYNRNLLGDPDKYRVSFKSMISSQEHEMVNLAQAQAAVGVIPQKIIITDILKAEDPDGWMRELELEKAKQANPAISLAEMAVRYAEEAEDTEDPNDKELKNLQSKMLVHMAMRQRMQPQLPEGGQAKEMPEQKPNLQGLASMPKLMNMGIGGGNQAQPQQTQEVVR
jgi:hypothetical protein